MSERNSRAERLLRSIVSPEEFHEYLHKDHIAVHAHNGKYVISPSNIKYTSEKGCFDMCVIFCEPYADDPNGIPDADWVIMKYLLVKGDPERLWSTAVIGGWGERPQFI